MTHYIIGHQNPDTDAICSALVYAIYLNDNNQSALAIALGEANLETKFVLSRKDIFYPPIIKTLDPHTQVTLVDHNEAGQSIENLSELEICAVFDHHKFSGFATSGPLLIRTEALGSTCSILRKYFKEKSYTPNEECAYLMISAIISDTLFFRSPTTTQEDKDIVHELNKIAQIDNLETFSNQMFEAKSNIDDLTDEMLITMDYKIYTFGNYTTGVAVIETTMPKNILQRKDSMIKAINDFKEKNAVDILLVSVVDIIKEQNITIVASEQEKNIISQVFKIETKEGLADLGKRISRKKQIVKVLDSVLS